MMDKRIILLVVGNPFTSREVYLGDVVLPDDWFDGIEGGLREGSDVLSRDFNDLYKPLDSCDIPSWWDMDFLPALESSSVTHVLHREFGGAWSMSTKEDFLETWR